MSEYSEELENFLKEIESFIEKETRGRRGYCGLKPAGNINFTKFSPEEHQEFIRFVKDRGFSLGQYYYGFTHYILKKSKVVDQVPDMVEAATLMLIPDIDAPKEKVLSWGKSLPVERQKEMEECMMWNLKIFKALTQGEKQLDSWHYIGQRY